MLVKPVSESVFLRGWAKERCAKSGAERSNPELCWRWIADRWGALQMKVLSHVANRRNRRTIVAVFGIKKQKGDSGFNEVLVAHTLRNRTEFSETTLQLARQVMICLFVLAISMLATGLAEAQTFSVLYEFQFGPDGARPYSSLVRDGKGNLYGTTTVGGSSKNCLSGCGTVFKLDTSGNETVLHSFTGKDGANPYGGLVRDSQNNLYGTTLNGGAHGAGTIFKIAPHGRETVLYSFSGGADGGFPYAGLVRDKAGNLYGTTYLGGTCPAYYGCGTVFKLDTTGKEAVIYNFKGGLNDGAFPYAGLVRDAKGNLYGTTVGGGDGNCLPDGCGSVFKIGSNGREAMVYLFQGLDGFMPYGGLVRDKSGNLYGTTSWSGLGQGSVFSLSPSGNRATLYTFTGGADGSYPLGTLVRDSTGNLYGTTYQGGPTYAGTVFKLDTGGNLTVLYGFSGSQDGGAPAAGLLLDSSGIFYGTASWAGLYFPNGTVFKVTP